MITKIKIIPLLVFFSIIGMLLLLLQMRLLQKKWYGFQEQGIPITALTIADA